MSSLRLQQQLRRHFRTAARWQLPLKTGPAPQRLPEREQKIFEELQRASTGAFSTPRPVVDQSPASPTGPKINQSPHLQQTQAAVDPEMLDEAQLNATIEAKGKGEELHPDIRRGAAPEFEGDRNPKTGEIGGPKNDPLRWGADVDWSYNGRVTDF